MASYEAQINVILNGQRSIDALASSLGEVQAAIDQIERRWRSATQLIQRTQIRLNAIGTEPPRGQGGRFTGDPNRQARFEAYAVQRRARGEEFLSRRAIARGRSEEAIVGNQITGQREAIKLAERRAEIESRQNSAAILFERQLQAFRRGGGGTRLDPQLQERAREAQAAYNAIGGAASRNRGLVSALATEMGRVVQAQNEMNRGGSLRSKAFETSRRTLERISAVEDQGMVSGSRLRRARNLANPITEAANSGDQFAFSEATRKANAFISRLERESQASVRRAKTQAPMQSALGAMEGRGSNPFGISDKQINKVLDARASDYMKGLAETEKLQQVLGGMEGKKYNPFGISDKQINEGYQVRASNLIEAEKATKKATIEGLKSAIALEKQRLTAVERILQVEEKIKSAKRITKAEALDYYFQGGLQQLALPFGDESLPGIRGGARRGAGRNIERLGGARTADQAQSTLRFAQANSQLAKSVSAVDTEYNRFLPDTKMLNATGRGIQRLKTDQDQFNESVKSGTRFQQKYNEEQERQRKIYGNRYPVGTVKPDGMAKGAPIDGQKKLTSIYNANRILLGKVVELEARGLNAASERIAIRNQENRILSGTFNITSKNLDAEYEALSVISRSIQLYGQREKILKSQSTGYPSSPIGGGVNMPGSPIFNQTPFLERRFGARGGAAISEGLIGGAFPLLFGQGVGAAAGGGLGGALGGFAGGGLGFGLSLIGTAVGSALDGVTAAAKDAAASLQDPITNFQKLADSGLALSNASLKADQAQQLQIRNLIEYGNSTKAAAIIQGELAKKIGVLAMRDMANLDNQSVRLGKAWAELNLQIQAAIAGPLAGLLEWTANMINLFTSGTRKKVDEQNFIDSLPADVKKEYIRQKQANLYGAQPDAAIRAKFQGQAGPLNLPKANIDPLKLQEEQDKLRQEDRDKDDKLLQRKIEAEDLIRNSQNQSRQFEYQLIDLRRQGIDLQRRVNDDIFNKQQQIQRDQISNDRLRKQIAIDTVDLQYSKMISNEEGRAAAVLSAEADLVKMRSTNAAEIEVARRSLEIDIAKQQRDTQNYIYGLAREADSIRRATLNYEVQIEDYRIAQERKIAEIRRSVMREEEDIQIKRDRGSPVYQGQAMGDGAYAGKTGGGQLDASAGRSSGPHLHAQGGPSIEALRRWVDSALSFNGMTASQLSIKTSGRLGRGAYGPGGHGYIGQDYYIDQATPFALRPGWQSTDMGIRGALGRGLAVKGPNGESFQLGHLVDAVTTAARSGAAQSASAAPAAGRTNTEAAIVKANTNDAVVQARPAIPGVPVSKISGQQTALDNQGNKIKQDAIALQEKLNKLGEEGALQRVLDAARGENTVKQKNRELDILKAEAMSIDATASEKQAIATLDARSAETLKQVRSENETILKNTKLTGKEKEKLVEATAKYLANTEAALAVDKAMLETQQEMRFISEIAEKRLQLRNRDAAINVGFFGAGAQAYNQELTAGSGDSAKAAEQARLTRASEVQNEIVQIRENIQSLIDPTNQVIGGAKAIGGAFSDSFKAVFLGAKSGREALADFFQKTGEHFLEMATQMMAQKIILDLIGFGLSSFGLSGATGSIASGFQLPGQAFMPAGGSFKFANGGAFTNSVVSSPTLFQFANGGALSNGVMGEAGPEAVMPLSRGPGGRLGVDASGMATASREALQQAGQEVAASREALQQVSQSDSSKGAVGTNGFAPQSKMFAESRQALATSTRSQETASSESPAPLRIETIQVGKLDVVTVQQAKAIADASSARGNAKQTRLLQSSPAARRSMGI